MTHCLMCKLTPHYIPKHKLANSIKYVCMEHWIEQNTKNSPFPVASVFEAFLPLTPASAVRVGYVKEQGARLVY